MSPGRRLLAGGDGVSAGRGHWRVVQATAANAIVDDTEDLPIEQQHGHTRQVERTH